MISKASIIICTRNRAQYLQQTLTAMAQVHVPDEMLAELIVVDNASTDATRNIVNCCALTNLPVRYVAEFRHGQCYARNTGIDVAQGDIIIFTDDDVRPPANWIGGMCAPILSGKADAVAGDVRMAQDLRRAWMQPVHKIYFADTTSLSPSDERFLFGANMAFSRNVLSKVPAFDCELGPGALGFWDDMLFSYQLVAAGYKIGRAVNVVVEHHFDSTRLSRASYYSRATKDGRSRAYLAYHWEHSNVTNVQRKLLRARLRLLFYRSGRGERWVHKEGMAEWEMALLDEIGFYKQFLIERQRPRNYTRHGLLKLVH